MIIASALRDSKWSPWTPQTSKGHQHEGGATPLIIFEFICVVGAVARCVAGTEEHPQLVPPCGGQDAAQQLHFVMSLHLPHTSLMLWSELLWKRIHCSLVIQQTHSSVSALTITSRRSLPNGTDAKPKETSTQASSEGFRSKGKGGIWAGQREGKRGHRHSFKFVVVWCLDRGKRGPKTDGRPTLSVGIPHKPRWKLAS